MREKLKGVLNFSICILLALAMVFDLYDFLDAAIEYRFELTRALVKNAIPAFIIFWAVIVPMWSSKPAKWIRIAAGSLFGFMFGLVFVMSAIVNLRNHWFYVLASLVLALLIWVFTYLEATQTRDPIREERIERSATAVSEFIDESQKEVSRFLSVSKRSYMSVFAFFILVLVTIWCALYNNCQRPQFQEDPTCISVPKPPFW